MEAKEILNQAEEVNKYQSFEDIIFLMRKHYLIPDPGVIKVTLAGVVAHYFNTDPLWIFLIAPPSSMKTELISALNNIEDIYQLSSLTPQTFFSGLRKRKDQTKANALLLKIKNKIFTLKDFGSVLSMRHEEKAILLAQLREIYDGKYSARYGNGVEIDWKGKIGFIAGVTPAIDTHYSVFQVLGERFIQYRLNSVDESKLGRTAMDLIGEEKEIRKEIRHSFNSFLSQLKILPIKEIKMSEDIKKSIVQLACLCVRGRSGVVRDHYKKTLEYVPAPEAPARLAKQLATLAYALAIIDKRQKVNFKDYLLVLKVGLDCIPRQRITALNFLAREKREFKTGEIAEGTDYSREGIRIHLEDLVAHKLVTIKKQGQGYPDVWSLSQKTYEYLSGMMPKKTKENLKFIEKLKEKTKKNISNYNNLINCLLNIPTIRG